MDAHGVYIFNKADRDHVVVRIADDLELELLPAEDRLLDEDLVDQGCLQAAGHDRLQLLHVVDKAAAGAAHRVGRTEDDRVTQPVGDRETFLDAVGDFGAGHLDAEHVHGFLEFNTVLAALDRVDLDADDLDIVFVEDALLVELRGKVEAGLAAEVRQQRIRALLCDDLLEARGVQRLDVGDVRHLRIRHNGGRVGVDKDDLVAEASERLARLRAGIVKLTGLADDDRTRSDDQYLLDVCSKRHILPPLSTAALLYPYYYIMTCACGQRKLFQNIN